jgi:hypothetical protein
MGTFFEVSIEGADLHVTKYSTLTAGARARGFDPAVKARLEGDGFPSVLKMITTRPPSTFAFPATPAGVASFTAADHQLREYTAGGDGGHVAAFWWLLDGHLKHKDLYLVPADAVRIDGGHVGHKPVHSHYIAHKHMRLFLADEFLEEEAKHQAAVEAWQAQYRDGLAGLLSMALMWRGSKAV